MITMANKQVKDAIVKVTELVKDSTLTAFPRAKGVLVTIAVELEDGEFQTFYSTHPKPIEFKSLSALAGAASLLMEHEDVEQ